MISRQTSLSKNIVSFCRYLRHHGFSISAEEESDALLALGYINYQDRTIFKLAIKAICCKTRNQLEEFDNLFEQYWRELEKAVDAKLQTDEKPLNRPGKQNTPFKSLHSWVNGNREKENEETSFYSVHENLSHKDFASVPDDELDELMQSIKSLSKRLAAHLNRRYEKNNRTDLPDLRRTLRKNMRTGGELIELIFHRPKRNRIKLVILCDVSKSMDIYAAFLLQFMYAFQQVYSRVETFAFSTSLQPITKLIRNTDFRKAMQLIGSQHSGWSGGTKIGASLKDFVENYSSQLLDKKTIVLIMSDGWDTGDIEMLSRSMKYIHSKAKKTIWLNPLAGYRSYSPDVAGMQAALPYVDVFASVHNAASLRKLVSWL
jgi:uncharacterized protein with von Willebrand factor type A (vWA) domain